MQNPWRELDASSLVAALVQGREPLDHLAHDALKRLQDACSAREGPLPVPLIGAYGNAARLCFHNGRMDDAETLLHTAFRLCEEGWSASGDPAWCTAIL